jgi:hypothetical protein
LDDSTTPVGSSSHCFSTPSKKSFRAYNGDLFLAFTFLEYFVYRVSPCSYLIVRAILYCSIHHSCRLHGWNEACCQNVL